MRHGVREGDRLQCTAISKRTGKRCTRIGTHSNGGGVLCRMHHEQLQVKRKS